MSTYIPALEPGLNLPVSGGPYGLVALGVFSLLASGARGSRELRRLRWEGFGRLRAAGFRGGVWAPGLLSEFRTTIQPATEGTEFERCEDFNWPLA